MQTAGTSLVPLERGAGPESQADLSPFPRSVLCFTQLFTHHRAGLASLKGDSAALPAA